jgi:hypothetical protein
MGVFADSGQSLGPNDGHGHAILGDLDGDGDLDALVTNSASGSRVYRNDGSGVFTDSGQVLGTRSQKGCLSDLDGDGDLDAITTHRDDGNPVWLNDGTATFSAAGVHVGNRDALAITAGNIDSDQDPDVFIGKFDGTGGNKLYLNQTSIETQSIHWGRVKSLFRRP